ncbi:hypothetical protein THASP1DRAFT_29468 [Thamnocephalis sphaerospora]|uniref:Uncharacterized protein n=1 Tax=Thamnocephalis sphaerospora TaxID=78915 RepID=A0A4V1IWU0_9FUNG|nr:hypothetical protein THASP1DRAFT_29468 [Thamnocephalis sphaerospora]|eukprot:RKP08729.1 hypothetical protein THASP1DRAFT_29468 [Thamnocephalis sphaerospora]
MRLAVLISSAVVATLASVTVADSLVAPSSKLPSTGVFGTDSLAQALPNDSTGNNAEPSRRSQLPGQPDRITNGGRGQGNLATLASAAQNTASFDRTSPRSRVVKSELTLPNGKKKKVMVHYGADGKIESITLAGRNRPQELM